MVENDGGIQFWGRGEEEGRTRGSDAILGDGRRKEEVQERDELRAAQEGDVSVTC